MSKTKKFLFIQKHNNYRSILVIVAIVFQSLLAIQVANSFQFSAETCRKYGLGKSWYCESESRTPAQQNKAEESPYTTPDEIMQRDVPPEQKALLLNQLWEVQQKRAVITGAQEDLENVLMTQTYIAKLGTDFGKKMIRLIESDPRYHMSQSYYQNISEEVINDADIAAVLSAAKTRYAIAFIYMSDCSYCKQQLPVLMSLKSKYGITILGISTSGESYSGLDEYIRDPSITSDPSIQAYPTIILLDSKSEKRIFVAKGLATQDRLEKLIYRRILEVENA